MCHSILHSSRFWLHFALLLPTPSTFLSSFIPSRSNNTTLLSPSDPSFRVAPVPPRLSPRSLALSSFNSLVNRSFSPYDAEVGHLGWISWKGCLKTWRCTLASSNARRTHTHTHLQMRLNPWFQMRKQDHLQTQTHTQGTDKKYVHLASLESVGVDGTNCALGLFVSQTRRCYMQQQHSNTNSFKHAVADDISCCLQLLLLLLLLLYLDTQIHTVYPHSQLHSADTVNSLAVLTLHFFRSDLTVTVARCVKDRGRASVAVYRKSVFWMHWIKIQIHYRYFKEYQNLKEIWYYIILYDLGTQVRIILTDN